MVGPLRPEAPLVSDCPVQPHVFREFSQHNRNERMELIATCKVGEAISVVGFLRQWLPPGNSEQAGMFLYDDYVLVDADFESLISAVLPLTRWGDFLRRASQLSSAEIEAEMRAVSEPQDSRTRRRTERSTSERLSYEDYGRLRWLLSQIAAVRPRLDGATVSRWLRIAAERRARGPAPILSVGFNRWADPAVNKTRVTIKADAAEKLFDIDCSEVTWAVVDTGIDVTHPMMNLSRQTGEPDTLWRRKDLGPPVGRVARIFDIPRAVEELRRRNTSPGYAEISSDEQWREFR